MNIVFSLTVIICSSIIISGDAAASDPVEEICPQTRNSSLCFRELGSGTNRSFRDLAQRAVERASFAGFFAADAVRASLVQAIVLNKRKLIEGLRRCTDDYGDARQAIHDASEALQQSSGNYPGLLDMASAAETAAATCDGQLEHASGGEVIPLKTVSNYFEDIVSILIVAAKYLV